MSPLTKAFVVLVTVLSIVLVALVVPYVANSQNLQEQVTKEKSRAQTAEALARAAQADLQAADDRASQVQSELQSTIADLTGKLTQSQTALRSAEAQANVAEAKLTQFEGRLAVLSQAEKQNAALLGTAVSQLRTAQEELVDKSTRLVTLTARNEELDASNRSLMRQVALMQERSVAYQQKLAWYEDALAKLPSEVRESITAEGQGATAEVLPDDDIVGLVTAVRNPTGDITLLQINVGRSDGVKEGMAFLVSRDGKFLGKLLVKTVTASESAGEVQLQQDDLKAGDVVSIQGRGN